MAARLEENDPGGQVLLMMVALEDLPCVCVFPGMKPWTAWVHFHRKYSTYCHKLKYVQTAGASGVWVSTYRILLSVHNISHLIGSMYSTSHSIVLTILSVQQGYKFMSGPMALSSMVLRAAQQGAGGAAVLLTRWQDSRTAEDIQTGRIYWHGQGHRQAGRVRTRRGMSMSMLQARQIDMPVIIERKLPRVMYLHASKHRGQDEY
jgi:hypothetical protein